MVELGQEALGEGPPAVTEPDELALIGDDNGDNGDGDSNDDNHDNGKNNKYGDGNDDNNDSVAFR